MSSPAPSCPLVHPALAPAGGRAPREAGLTDRQRLAVLLQGCALLAHLRLLGWRLQEGWDGARVDAAGRLRRLRAAPGRSAELPQRQLVELARRLFGGHSAPAGPGAARRRARDLIERWEQGLVPVSPDLAVGQLLGRCGFLWQARYGEARVALAAEHRRHGARRLWVAGPGRFRDALLSASCDLAQLQELLRSRACRGLWLEAAGAAGGGRPAPAGERLRRARRLCRRGRYGEALRSLHRLRSPDARILRLRCVARLGRLTEARRLLGGLEGARLSPEQTLELGETAVRVLGNSGQTGRASAWVRRALGASPSELRPRAELLAAAAAWDRRDLAAMERRLDLARPALEDPRLAWRWHHLRGLGALQRGDGAGVVRHLAHALAEHRRRLSAPQAAGLWNELGIGRALDGDLAGAERALVHAMHLLESSDGPARTTLALANLAEIRLRRGRLGGVRSILERSEAENLRAGNWRGWAHDQELWMRYELARGEAREAAARAEDALAELRRRGLEWHREELHLLAARACGWLELRQQARDHLARSSSVALGVLEPEERPAVRLHAGDRRGARREIQGHPLAGLWRPVLAGEPPSAVGWGRVERLEPFRGARWVYDVERALPGLLPLERVRRAALALRRAGATRLADRLSRRETGAWSALRGYLRLPAPDAGEVARLLRAAGAAEARLVWRRGGEERLLIPGAGGAQRLSAPCAGGRLCLQASHVEGAVAAIFELAVRDLESQLAPPTRRGEPELVGTSPALLAALERVARLAPRRLPVLIRGETGTGKELVARRVHLASPRADRPFLAINCAALPEGVLLAELFGHRRGAFTGADRERAGIFEEAHTGTVFLDEIGDLPGDAQGTLLRVLQDGEVRRVGESRPRRVDVRIVAATHRDLEEMVSGGRFRADLFYRLDGGAVRLPPLRERGDDVLRLGEHFLARRGRLRLSAEARERLQAYAWPGNVRELQNRLRVAAALAVDGVIRAEHLDLPRRASAGLYHQRIQEVRLQLVRDALAAADGNQAAAARRLGISRQAFSYLVRRLDLSRGLTEGDR